MNESGLQIDAIIFDFDGVLVESVDIKGDAFVELYKNETPEVQKQVRGHHEKHGGVTRFDKIRHYEQTFCNREATEEKLRELTEKFSHIVENLVVKAPWVTGAKEFLDKYYKTIPFYVASGTPEDELKRIVKNRGMSMYFKEVYGSPEKKDKHINRIMAEHGYSPERVLMIGDATSDYNAAKKTGTRFIGRQLSGKDHPFPDGTPVIKDMSELESLITLAS